MTDAAGIIRKRAGDAPVAMGLILGSGLGALADEVAGSVRFPFGELPGFPISSVSGHAGEVVVGDLIAHSQLTLGTQGQLSDIQFCNGVDGSGGVSASFVEVSTPQAGLGGSTGRGLFTGVTEGEIIIEGTINCVGSIDMKFRGEICLLPQ